jgi:hypothetical protein
MFNLFKSEKPSLGLVYFEQVAPSGAKMAARLRAAGMEVAPAGKDGKEATAADSEWAFELSHPQHGKATVLFKKEGPPAIGFLEFSQALTNQERQAAVGATEAALVMVPAERKHVLRDRKRLLGFMRALMGDDGVLAVDLTSGMPWAPAALDDELAHDADLDPEALYVFHAVQEGEGGEEAEGGKSALVTWLHTHGLAELGGFDFDILRPNELVVQRANDPLRALAFAMLEGKISESTASFPLIIPEGAVRLVPAAEFMREASPEDRALRGMGPETNDAHNENRAVVCEPAGKGLLRSGKPEPSRLLSKDFDDASMLAFTTAGTELMAERARGTVGVFRRLMAEFADLGVNPLVKLGFETSQPGSNEHLWFLVHPEGAEGSAAPTEGSAGPNTVDCTLINEPFDVAGMREGLRARQSLDRLTDWTIITPAGWITPRTQLAARQLRALPPEGRAELAALVRDSKE